MRNCRKRGDWLNRHDLFAFSNIREKRRCDRSRRRKCSWSGAFSYEYPGLTIIPSTPSSIISSKKRRMPSGSLPSNSVVFVVTRNPRESAARIAFTATS